MADGTNGENRAENTGMRRLLPLLIGLPIIVIIAAAAVLLSGEGDRAPQSSGQGQQPSGGGEQASGGGKTSGDTKTSGNETLGHPALGDADAPVVLVEYSDYQ